MINQFLAVMVMIAAALITSPVHAAAADICQRRSVAVGFFNGVQTTEEDAAAALKVIKERVGTTTVQGDSLYYELFYNHTNGLEDFVEVFEQRMKEHNGLLAGRFELLLQLWQGDDGWWDKISASTTLSQGAFADLTDWITAQLTKTMVDLSARPPSDFDLLEHRTQIETLLGQGHKLLLIAHSQGNLFMNAAYQHATSKAPAEAVKAVHIAPATAMLSGPHTLADLDLVINGLRLTGRVPPITDQIPRIGSRQPGVNGKTDALGHGLQEIYLNPSHATDARIDQYIREALATLQAPPQATGPAFLTATLTWDGAGDVDLHVTEPDGTRVSTYQKRGHAGNLVAENWRALGPERYQIGCDVARLQEGVYSFSAAHYANAAGRRATLYIGTAADGLRGSQRITLVAPSNGSPRLMMRVKVTRAANGRYETALMNRFGDPIAPPLQ